MQVTWFRNPHEYRSDYFRFALMRRHLRGELRYRELPQEAGRDFGMSEALVTHEHRHTSVLVVEDDGARRLVAIDNEDGFVHMQPFIEEVDAYFCCPYTSAFHRDRGFPELLPWQTDFDVANYRERAAALVARYGEHFDKVRKLAPTPTALNGRRTMSEAEKRRARWEHRARKMAVWREDQELWRHELPAFEARYRQMLGYRDAALRYDVVSRESLWGWPNNRIALHRRLRALKAEGLAVHSQLTPLGETHNLSKNELAITEDNLRALDALTSPMDLAVPYEEALASSRLGVFPTGYHWGWRGIAFLALCMGIPALWDHPIYEPYFDFSRFRLHFNEGEWEAVGPLVGAITEEAWAETKAHNQATFDATLAPDAVGAYLDGALREVLTGAEAHV